MYLYQIKLYPESQKMRDGLDLAGTLEDVENVAKEYNKTAATASNRKKILKCEIENGNTVVVTLESSAWLEFPTKSLKHFISKLAKISPYRDLITPAGRLFKGESNFIEKKENPISIEGKMTDEEILVSIIQLFFRENQSNRDKIDKIEKILKEK